MDSPQRNVEPEWTDEDSVVDALLKQLYGDASIPEHLAEQVWTQSCPHLSNSMFDLEDQIKEAFTSSSSGALSEQIFAASVQSLPKNEEPVLARICSANYFRQIAIAATLILSTVIAMQFDTFNSQEPAVLKFNESYAGISLTDDNSYLLDSVELGDYAYLTEIDSREFAYVDLAVSFNSVRDDIELWQSGLLFE